MPKLQKLEQPMPLAKMAYETLRDSILAGHLKPGEVYNEMVLAKELGISRTPIREALLEISSHGLVTYLPRKGVQINNPTKRDVEEIFELRKAIELTAVEKVAKASPPHDFNKIEKSLEDQRKALNKKDFVDFLEADRTFHTTFSELTNNRRLLAIIENIRDMMHLIGVQALGIEGRGEEVIAEHEKVLVAVKRGKPGEAKRAMNYHLDRSKEAVDKAQLSD